MNGRALLDSLRKRRGEMVDSLGELVARESPSRDKAALDQLAEVLTGRFQGRGAAVERLPNDSGGDHLRVRFSFDRANQAADLPPALVLCHFDTVWPIGTLANMPFRIEDGRAFGPGAYDMKSGLVLLEFAIDAIRTAGLVPPRPIVALLTSDEEIGSPTSRALIENEARSSAYALVLEAPLSLGQLKTSRKGVGRYTIGVEGKAAHAGVEPDAGINAIVELAHQILRIQELADRERGTTLNVGLVRGGTALNVVPADALAEVDVRASTREEANRLDQALLNLQPILPGARLRLDGRINRPPLERTPAIVDLFERARRIGRDLGLNLEEGSTGGGSDGNFTAAVGLPTLDGLGALGAGAHAGHEHVRIESMPERAALLASLLLGL